MTAIYFKFWNFTMKLFHLLGFTKELFFAGQLLFQGLICFFLCFLDGSRFFEEPAEIVCHTFEAFSRGCILLELEMISFLPIIVVFL